MDPTPGRGTKTTNKDGSPVSFPSDKDLALMLGPDGVEKFKGAPTPPDRPHQMLLGFPISGIEYRTAVPQLYAELQHIPVDELSGAVYTGIGNFEGFKRLGALQGVGALPRGEMPYDATGRQAYPNPSARHMEVSRIVAELLVPDAIHARSQTVNRYSSTGLPWRKTDWITKLKAISNWREHGAEIVALTANDRLEETAKRFNTVRVLTGGVRFQPDLPSKKRVVLDDGEWIETDTTPPEPWASDRGLPAGFSWRRCRVRVINVASFADFPTRLFASSMKKHMENRFVYATVHKSRAAIAYKLNEGRLPFIYFVDVSNHDQNIPSPCLDQLIDVIATKLGPGWALLVACALRQAQLVRSGYPGRRGARLIGNPFSLDGFRARYVNPSGIPFTSEIARWAGLLYAAWIAVDAGWVQPTKASVAAFFAGENDVIKVLNAGDNLAIVCAEDPRQAVAACPVPIDQAGTFLGYAPFAAPGGGVTLEPSITSYVYNLFMPGRSASDPQRGDPQLGSAAREQYYSAARGYGRVAPLVHAVIRDCMGVDYPGPALQNEALGSSDVVGLFLDNIDRIHYSVDKDDLPRDVLDRYFISVTSAIMNDIGREVDRGFRTAGEAALRRALARVMG